MLSKNDFIVIAHLRGNARESLTSLSKKTKIPVSTLFQKIKENCAGAIIRHVSLVDWSLLGFSIKANIMLQTEKVQREELKKYLSKEFHVNSVYRINNGYDFLVQGLFHNIGEAESWAECLEERFTIHKKDVHYIIEDLKVESFMSDPTIVGLLSNI